MAGAGGQAVKKVFFRKTNKTAPVILAYVKDNPLCTTQDIIDASGIPARQVQGMIVRLINAGKMHIAAWEHQHSRRGKPARLFLIGPGENAPFPRPTKAQKRERKNEWQRAKRRQAAVIERASKNAGVFGILIAQVNTANRSTQ